jgi:hypothetical protein
MNQEQKQKPEIRYKCKGFEGLNKYEIGLKVIWDGNHLKECKAAINSLENTGIFSKIKRKPEGNVVGVNAVAIKKRMIRMYIDDSDPPDDDPHVCTFFAGNEKWFTVHEFAKCLADTFKSSCLNSYHFLCVKDGCEDGVHDEFWITTIEFSPRFKAYNIHFCDRP